jgi:hypothetical protein
MKFAEITPMLRTKDLKGSMEFYTRLLGFVLQFGQEISEGCAQEP